MSKSVSVEEITKGLYYCLHCSLCKEVLPSEVKSYRFSEICPPGAKFKFDAYLVLVEPVYIEHFSQMK